MRKVFQTDTTFISGNCFSACIASLLECSLEEVPTFVTALNWQKSCNEWLAKHRLQFIDLNWPMTQALGCELPCIVSGASPRNPQKLHSIVGKVITAYAPLPGSSERVFQNELTYLHDPHPEGGNVLDVQFVGMLVKVL